MRLSVFLLALFLAYPAHAVPPAKSRVDAKVALQKRRLADAKNPSRVITFVCREEGGEEENVIGMSHLQLDISDNNKGTFGMTIYVRADKGYSAKSLTGTYSTVPKGYVFIARWKNAAGDYATINLHPADKTLFPGSDTPQVCEISGQLESL